MVSTVLWIPLTNPLPIPKKKTTFSRITPSIIWIYTVHLNIITLDPSNLIPFTSNIFSTIPLYTPMSHPDYPNPSQLQKDFDFISSATKNKKITNQLAYAVAATPAAYAAAALLFLLQLSLLPQMLMLLPMLLLPPSLLPLLLAQSALSSRLKMNSATLLTGTKT